MNFAHAIPLADTWGMHGNVGWGWMTAMMIFMVLFWGALIFGIVWLVRGTAWGRSTHGEPPTSKESPLDILDRRFAEGDITEDDYRARREVLGGGTTGSNGARQSERVVTPLKQS
jgi:putative membrane protein